MATNNATNNTEQMAANSIRGNNTGAAALGADLTVAQTNTLLGVTTVGTSAVGQIAATATNDNAAAGKVGEFMSSVIAEASAVSLTNGTNADVTTLSLTAGDWDIWGNLSFVPGAGTTSTYVMGWLSLTSATVPDGSLYNLMDRSGVMTFKQGCTPPQQRLSLAAPATLYMSVQSGFAVSTMKACGGLYARRAR